MALWRIVVKNSGNAACKDKRQRLEKGPCHFSSRPSVNRCTFLSTFVNLVHEMAK